MQGIGDLKRRPGAGRAEWMLIVCAALLAGAWWAGSAPPARAQARTKVNGQDGLTYVWIPPGSFRMGCSVLDSECNPDESPVRQITLTKGFWIGRTLTTQQAYQKVTGTNPSYFKGGLLPVEDVSWEEARAYCGKIGMRLPTEAEWEFAARGGSPAASYAPQDGIAWYEKNSAGMTHPVAQLAANEYGLYDVLGSVWEWVADWYGPYVAGDASDPKGPATGTLRVMRGGSWLNEADGVRVSARVADPPTYKEDDAGFRCVGD